MLYATCKQVYLLFFFFLSDRYYFAIFFVFYCRQVQAKSSVHFTFQKEKGIIDDMLVYITNAILKSGIISLFRFIMFLMSNSLLDLM